jgi:SM-20-related protein
VADNAYNDAIERIVEQLKTDANLVAAAKEITAADMIKSYDNQIPEDLMAECIVEVERRGWQYGWRSNRDMGFGHWNVVLSDSKIERDDIYHEVAPCIQRLWDYIQPRFMPTTPTLVRAYANAHTYGIEGYIHRDSKFMEDQTAVIYYEKDWRPEWAGETVFFDDSEDVIKAILPRYGRLSVFPAAIPHCGRGVSRICPVARRVLVLKGRPK